MRELAGGLWQLRGRPANAFNVYLMGDVVVDAATRHAAARIRRQLAGHPVRAHVLTHGHLDHTGSTHELCTTLGLPLMCGAGDVGAVESGGRDGLAEMPAVVRLEHRLWAGPGHRVDRVLAEGDEVAGFTVLEVPGHSPGHLAFFRERDRALVLGDVFFNVPSLRYPPDVFTPDPALNRASAARLADLNPSVVCFGHGPPLRDAGRLRELVA